jgi:pyruvate formate lyase activating enzyme
LSPKVKELLNNTDRVLLDIKYTDNEDYIKNVGCEMAKPVEFLEYLSEKAIPTTLRQVIIPGVNDREDQVTKLDRIANAHKNVDKIELLPFRKICQVKYDSLGIEFPFAHIPEPTKEKMISLEKLLTK